MILVTVAEVSPFVFTNYVLSTFPFLVSFTGRGILLLIFSFPLMISRRVINNLNSVLFIITSLIEFIREFIEKESLSDKNEYLIDNRNNTNNTNNTNNISSNNNKTSFEMEEKA